MDKKVLEQQKYLNKKYNAGLKEDGIMGARTQAAFQKYTGTKLASTSNSKYVDVNEGLPAYFQSENLIKTQGRYPNNFVEKIPGNNVKIPRDAAELYKQNRFSKKPFSIVSKQDERMYAFDSNGNLVINDEVGIGKDKGDFGPRAFQKGYETTPAGEYFITKSQPGKHPGYAANNYFAIKNKNPDLVIKGSLTNPKYKEASGITQALHGIPKHLMGDRGTKLNNNSLDNRVSSGCINCNQATLDSPYFNALDIENYSLFVTPEPKQVGGYHNVLSYHAAQTGYDYDELLADYESETPQNQQEFLKTIMQEGGQQDQMMQIVQAFAQISGQDPQAIMQQLQSAPPEQQQQMMQQMMQAVQQAQGDEPEAQEEQIDQLGGYDHKSMMGYRDDSPYRFNKSNKINSNKITMNQTGTPLLGVSDTGDMQYMDPYSGEYEFQGSSVMEYPMAQAGVSLKSIQERYSKKLNIPVSKLPKDAQGMYNLITINANRLKDPSFEAQAKTLLPAKSTEVKSGLARVWDAFTAPVSNKPKAGQPLVTNTQTTPGISNWNSMDPFRAKNNIPIKRAPKGSTPAAKTTKGEMFKPLDGSEDWVGKWEKFLVSKNLIEGDHTYTVDEIDDKVYDYVKANPNEFKDVASVNDPALNKNLTDGRYHTVHQSFLPPNASGRIPFGAPSFDEAMADSDNMPAPSQTPFVPSGKNAIEQDLNPEYTGDIRDMPTGKAVSIPQQAKQLKNKQFKFNLNNPFESFANNMAVTQAFSPAALPYMEQVRINAAQAPLIDERKYIQEINNAFEPVKSNVNPNSTTGMAYLASLAGQQATKVTEVLNNVNSQNAQITAQNQAARVQAANQEFAANERSRANYYDQFLQGQAARDSGIQSAMNQVSQSMGRRIDAENSLQATLYNSPFLSDDTTDWDRIQGKRSIGLDPIEWQKSLQAKSGKNEGDTFTSNGKTYVIVDGKAVEQTIAQTGLKKFLKKKLYV
jgi:hypothetical protein